MLRDDVEVARGFEVRVLIGYDDGTIGAVPLPRRSCAHRAGPMDDGRLTDAFD